MPEVPKCQELGIKLSEKKTVKERLKEKVREIQENGTLQSSDVYSIDETIDEVFDSFVAEIQKQSDPIHETIGEFNELIEKMKLSSEDFSQQILGLRFTIANSVGRLYMIERFLELLGEIK